MARYISNLPKIHFGMCYTEVTETGSSHSIAQKPSETGDQYLQHRYDKVQKGTLRLFWVGWGAYTCLRKIFLQMINE